MCMQKNHQQFMCFHISCISYFKFLYLWLHQTNKFQYPQQQARKIDQTIITQNCHRLHTYLHTYYIHACIHIPRQHRSGRTLQTSKQNFPCNFKTNQKSSCKKLFYAMSQIRQVQKRFIFTLRLNAEITQIFQVLCDNPHLKYVCKLVADLLLHLKTEFAPTIVGGTSDKQIQILDLNQQHCPKQYTLILYSHSEITIFLHTISLGDNSVVVINKYFTNNKNHLSVTYDFARVHRICDIFWSIMLKINATLNSTNNTPQTNHSSQHINNIPSVNQYVLVYACTQVQQHKFNNNITQRQAQYDTYK
eukprot:TRINITY_DN1460_c0_g1_i1.p3 TRINITY_DN1460_c0_g1~~TRINITY_DN1460_c0_g1_i1.p3  ORF type:complete len:305 (+),score=-21.65 TRINITY_DN1460_c0_g1_i1:993-1907(+)